MKKILFIGIITLLTILSCKKSYNDSVNGYEYPFIEHPIKTISFISDNYYWTYYYDNRNRLIKVLETNGSYDLYTYSNNIIVIDYFDSLGNSQHKDSLFLDVRGLVKIVKPYYRVNDTSQFVFTDTTEYFYNSDGYCIKEIIHSEDTCKDYLTFTITEGNTDHWTVLSPCWPYNNHELYYVFYKDSLNTIGNSYRGMSFWGRDNKNPMKTGFTKHDDGTIIQQGIYTYIYNGMGLIEQLNLFGTPWNRFTYY